SDLKACGKNHAPLIPRQANRNRPLPSGSPELPREFFRNFIQSGCTIATGPNLSTNLRWDELDHMRRGWRSSLEHLEPRSMSTLVFVFNGNGFGEAKPDSLTQTTAALIEAHGDHAIQLTMPAMNGPGPFYQVASEVRSLSKGQS